MSEFEQKCDSAQPLVAALFRAPFATHGKARKGAVPLLSNVHGGIIARLFAQGKAHEQPRRRSPSRSCNWTRPCLSSGRTPTLQSAAPQPCNQPHSNLAIRRTPTLQSDAPQPCNQTHPNLAIRRTPTLQSDALLRAFSSSLELTADGDFKRPSLTTPCSNPRLHAAAHAGVRCKYAGHWEKAPMQLRILCRSGQYQGVRRRYGRTILLSSTEQPAE